MISDIEDLKFVSPKERSYDHLSQEFPPITHEELENFQKNNSFNDRFRTEEPLNENEQWLFKALRSNEPSHHYLPAKKEYEDFIKNSLFLKKINDTGPINSNEDDMFKRFSQYLTYGQEKVNFLRLPHPNTILLVGGNWIYDENNYYVIPPRIEIGTLPENDPEIKKILHKYYTLNPNGFADFTIGIDNPNLLAILPPHYFKEIYFERLSIDILMNRSVWKIIEHLCVPGGKIKIITGGSIRSLAFMCSGTKWERQILNYLEKKYEKAKNRKILMTQEEYLSKKEQKFNQKKHSKSDLTWADILNSSKHTYDNNKISLGTIILTN